MTVYVYAWYSGEGFVCWFVPLFVLYMIKFTYFFLLNNFTLKQPFYDKHFVLSYSTDIVFIPKTTLSNLYMYIYV